MTDLSPTLARFDAKLLGMLDSLDMKARYVVEGFVAGMHESPFHGFSVEFSEYREYEPGDDLRHVDWKVFGRSDRLYVKQYMQETNVRMYILCDTSRSMAYRGAAAWGSKLEASQVLSAALTRIMLQQNDAVGMLALTPPGDSPDFIRPSQKPGQFGLMLRHLDRLQASGEGQLAALLQHTARLAHRRSMILLFTDLLEPAEQLTDALRELRFGGHDVLIFQVLDRDEVEFPFTEDGVFEDLEGGRRRRVSPAAARDRYLQRFQTFMAAHYRQFSSLEMQHFVVRTDCEPWRALTAFLAERKRLA
jgi:uncharacterized protein (DUF58 family)